MFSKRSLTGFRRGFQPSLPDLARLRLSSGGDGRVPCSSWQACLDQVFGESEHTVRKEITHDSCVSQRVAQAPPLERPGWWGRDNRRHCFYRLLDLRPDHVPGHRTGAHPPHSGLPDAAGTDHRRWPGTVTDHCDRAHHDHLEHRCGMVPGNTAQPAGARTEPPAPACGQDARPCALRDHLPCADPDNHCRAHPRRSWVSGDLDGCLDLVCRDAHLSFFGNEVLCLVGVSLLGMLIAVLTRSVGAAVGIALAYVLVPEGVIAMVLQDGSKWFPVRVLNFLPGSIFPPAVGPTPPQGYTTALLVALLWMVGFVVVSAVVFRRQDVSA